MNITLFEQYLNIIDEARVSYDKVVFWKKTGNWSIFFNNEDKRPTDESHIHYRNATRTFQIPMSDTDLEKLLDDCINFYLTNYGAKIATGISIDVRFMCSLSKRRIFIGFYKDTIPGYNYPYNVNNKQKIKQYEIVVRTVLDFNDNAIKDVYRYSVTVNL